MTKLKIENALVCEYIALGAHGKHNIINTYSGGIIVAEIPALIPVAFYLEIAPSQTFSTEMTIKVLYGKATVAQVEVSMEFELGKIGLIVLPQLALRIEKEGELEVLIVPRGGKPISAIKKTVELGAIP